MNVNDFFIRSNDLNIRLSRNLITQFHGDRFRKYKNKWQLIQLLTKTATNIFVFQKLTFENIFSFMEQSKILHNK